MRFRTVLALASRAASLAPLALLATACGDDVGETTVEPRATLMQVSPDDFLGTVPCLDAAGAARVYVATLTDVTPGELLAPDDPNQGTLPSSGPVPCTSPVAFSRVLPAHRYTASVEIYDRADLVARASGQPELVDPVSNDTVPARWTTSCGGEEGVRAENRLTRPLGDCTDPVLAGEPAPTAVAVSLAGSLGELGCAADGGALDHFVVRRAGEELARAACGETVTLTDVVPGEVLAFELLGFAGADDTEPSHGAACSARVLAGVTVTAACGPLAANGALAIDLEQALAALGASCDPSLIELVLALPEADPPEKRLDAASCRGTSRFAALAPGDYTVSASAELQGGVVVGPVTCAAHVEPGLSALADCATE